jgi:two-component system CheB/CheR fusion protein
VVLNGALRVVTASQSYYQHFHAVAAETVGRPIYELLDHQWDIPSLRELLETVLPRDQSFEGFEVEQDVPPIGRSKMLVSARRIVSKAGDTQLILMSMRMPGTRVLESA